MELDPHPILWLLFACACCGALFLGLAYGASDTHTED